MTAVALRLGPLADPGLGLLRSGFRWIVPDGALCKAGDPIASCNIGFRQDATTRDANRLFDGELQDFHVIVAPRIGGRLRHAPRASRGGFLDLLFTFPWQADCEIGRLEPTGSVQDDVGDAGLLRLMMLAGRRMTDLAESRSGLLTGWYDRRRAWWGDGDGPTGTFLSVATCEQAGLVQGGAAPFASFLSHFPGPSQMVIAQDEPLVPCARVLVEQMSRTDAERQVIAEDLTRSLLSGPATPTPADWLFTGALLRALNRSPLLESTPVLRRHGIGVAATAAAVAVSLMAEIQTVGRHRRLGYTVALHGFRLAAVGPATRHWLRTDFAPVRRTVEHTRQDYLDLLAAIKAKTGARLLVLNTNATPVHERIDSYDGFARPLSETLGSVRTKELALMLHDLAAAHPLDVVDVDALGARYGLRDHLPDGVHHSGALQDAMRAEVCAILRERNVPGFA